MSFLYCLELLDFTSTCSFFFFFFFFLFGLTLGIWKFPGQGSNLSCSCDLCHSCSNTGSLTYCATAGTPQPAPFELFSIFITVRFHSSSSSGQKPQRHPCFLSFRLLIHRGIPVSSSPPPLSSWSNHYPLAPGLFQ